jgi:hypothetical protein
VSARIRWTGSVQASRISASEEGIIARPGVRGRHPQLDRRLAPTDPNPYVDQNRRVLLLR